MIALSRAHMLAPDGRCKTFDAAADGFARGEGCGVLVLKRLTDAHVDGDRVLALILGTAANQDGRSGGLTVPSGPAQEAVIRAALEDAGIEPSDVGYVEAHGTGTSLGDPIEVKALARALGPGRAKDEPLLIGSVKTNFGHLESAAGVAGVMKTVLALQHEQIPPHLHFRTPSPHIAWAEYPVEVTAGGRSWPRGGKRRRAGVSSFGFSGTNVHVILEEAPPEEPVPDAAERPAHVLPVSARSPEALVALAEGYGRALERGVPLADAARTAGVGRSHLQERLAVVAASAREAADALAAAARGEEHPAVRRGSTEAGQRPEIAFLYTGQGSQYPGMGQALYETAPVFRDVIDACDRLLGRGPGGLTLLEAWRTTGDSAPIHQTAWTQPALFAVELALTALWRSWGIEPSAVIGHSLGEIAAACAAGVFSLEDGLQLVAERGRLMQALPEGGSMASFFAPPALVEQVIGARRNRVSIAAVNGPDNVVISGDAGAVEEVFAELAARNVQGHRLLISLAGHSPRVEPALPEMEKAARRVSASAPRIPVAWNLTGGRPLPGGAPDPGYWVRHLREPVLFADGLASLHRSGYRVFLEVGPHPVLVAMAQRSQLADVTLVPSIRRNQDDWRELAGAVAELFVRGAAIDFAGFLPQGSRRTVLPTYPFQRQRFWIDPGASARRRAPLPAAAHPLLGGRLPAAVPIFEATLTERSLPYLAEHRLHGSVLLAGPVYLEMALAAAREALSADPRVVEQFVVHRPLFVPEDGREVQTHLGVAGQDGAVPFSVHSRAPGSADWELHATGRLSPGRIADPAEATSQPPEALSAPERPLGAHYAMLAGLGVDLGPSFRTITAARAKDGRVLATLGLSPERAADPVAWAHPCLLDGALQAVGLALPEPKEGEPVHLFGGAERIELATPLPESLSCSVALRPADPQRAGEVVADVVLRTRAGALAGTIGGVRLRRAPREALGLTSSPTKTAHYQVAWEDVPAPLVAARALLGPERLLPGVRERFESLAVRENLAIYDELLPELDRQAAAHVGVALVELGFDPSPGRTFTSASEATALAVASRHQRLFARLLDLLVSEGTLVRRGESYETVPAPGSVDPLPRDAELAARFAPHDGELSMLRRCGRALARVLRGEQDPVPLLFPDGGFGEAKKLYEDSPSAKAYNGALAQALRAAIGELPPEARLRVLEIGAGTGGTTSFVLPALPADRVSYTFTDVSPVFLERAAERFGSHAGFRRALLDVQRDPVAQGFEAAGFDVVIAANVLHVAADLGRALDHVRKLLAPGGLLLLLEGTAPEPWVDVTFGLTEGWWSFADPALRPDYPLLSRERWLTLLAEHGFTEAAAVPAKRAGRAAQQALLLARANPSRRFTLIGEGGGFATELAMRLRARGDDVALVPAEAESADAADVAVYLGALALSACPSSDPATLPATHALAGELPLRWLARVARGEVASSVWLVTRGAVAAGGPLAEGGAWQAPLWGLGRVFALEHPGRWGGLVDLPPTGTDAALAGALLATIDAGDGEDQVAWRDGARKVARLVSTPAPEQAPIGLRADATYLVTGGFGGLGLLVGRWLAERGARHVALLGRRPDPSLPGVRAIEAAGARVYSLAGDVADRDALCAALASLAGDAPALRGVVHAAAALGAAPLAELSPDELRGMLRPKVDGTLLLDTLTRDTPLDFLALFSSTTALLGAAGLAHYAAANAFLDAFAHAARASGRRVVSVNWGTWEAMRLASVEAQRSYREAGLEPMPAAEALEALGRLLAGDAAQCAVARVDWDVLKPLHEARRGRPLLRRLGAGSAVASKRGAATAALVERLAKAPAGARRDVLLDYVRGEVAQVLGSGGSADAVPPAAGFFELGMDSLMSVELKRRIERGAGKTLPSTLTFNYPNSAALAAFLDEALTPAGPAAPAPVAVAAPGPTAPPPAVPERDLDELSDDELEARLRARLERAR
jgi:acyl transferase domain-containing protein